MNRDQMEMTKDCVFNLVNDDDDDDDTTDESRTMRRVKVVMYVS